jgi:hypothetical protein
MGEACSTHGNKRNYRQSFGREKLQERNHYKNLDLYVRIILEWIRRRSVCELDLSGSGCGPVVGCCGHCNKCSLSINDVEI